MKKNLEFERVFKAFKEVLRAAAKAEDKELCHVTSADFWQHANGKISVWQVRKYGHFTGLKDKIAPFRPTVSDLTDIAQKRDSKLEKKNVAIQQENAIFFNYLREFSREVFAGRVKASLPPKHLTMTPGVETTRIINAVFSDLHIGSDLRKTETGVQDFLLNEESRRLACVFRQIVDYKPQYRSQTELELLLLGDIIQNQLHDMRDGAPLAEQVARAIHLLSQGIAYAAKHFKKVRIRCTPGNHGRNTARHHDRATLQKWDSIETMIYTALSYACEGLTNVEFFIPLTPFITYENFGSKIFATHGDTVINPGNPSKSINIKSLKDQINDLNAGLKDTNEYKVVICGHVHIASLTYLPNGVVMVTNGPLVPPDQFAVSIGATESRCGQWLIESVKGHPVGDSRLITVGPENDKDQTLDAIIKPWKQFK